MMKLHFKLVTERIGTTVVSDATYSERLRILESTEFTNRQNNYVEN